MKKSILLFTVSLCFLFAQAQIKTTYPVSGGLLGHMNFSSFKVSGSNSSGIDYNMHSGWGAGAWLNFPVSQGFSIEPQFIYDRHNYKIESNSLLLMNDGHISYFSVPILLKIGLGKSLSFNFGPQFDFVSSIEDDKYNAEKSDVKKVSIAATAGLELFPHGPVSIFARYAFGFNDIDNRGLPNTGIEYKNLNLSAGLKLRLFGKPKVVDLTPVPDPPKDSDGDGILDVNDKCPTVPGVAKYEGCPVPDTDGDGINDDDDKCPTVKGVAKYQGCPIPDTDGDGINDEDDKCPTVPGVAAYQGCPVPDRDKDGIPDSEDKCPDVPGVAAEQGCPEITEEVTKTINYAAKNVYFNTASTKLLPKSFAKLDDVVKVLNDNMSLKLKIDGHTDYVGADDYNLKLSDGRAASVKAYLVSKGIDESRLTSEGFGETMPIADNKTAAGRAENRRVEMKAHY